MWQLIIFIIAFVFRLIYILQSKSTDPLFYHPIMDGLYHHDWAVSIIKGGWLGKDAFFRAPLYPYFLAIIYKVFGINFLMPRIVQSLIGAANCVLVQKIGSRIFDKRTGNLAGIVAAMYPLFIYFDNELLFTTSLIFFCLLGFYLILKQVEEKGRSLGWFLTGVTWGFAAITAPVVLAFTVTLPFWLRATLKGKFKNAVLFGLLGIVSVIAPVSIRNYIVSRDFVLIAWQGGTNFYIGNNPHSDGMTAIIPGTRKSWWGGFYDAKRIAEEATRRTLKNSEIDSYWFRQGVEFIKNQPVKALGLQLKKAYLFFGGFEIPNNRDIYFFTRSTYLKFTIWNVPFFQFPFGLLFPLALCGIWYARKRKKDISLMLLFIVFYSLSYIVFFVCARYRMPDIPFLVILASFAIYTFKDEISKRKLRYQAPALLIFVVSFLLSNANFFNLKGVNPALNYLTLADMEYKKENYQKAVFYLDKSLRLEPSYAEALNLMGASYKKMGKRKEALEYYLKSIKQDSKQPEAYYNIGNIYAEIGNYEEAKTLYLKAIEVDPYSAKAYNNLGNIYFTRGDYNQALMHYTKASTLEANYTAPLYHMGLVYAKLGDIAKAESLWRKVLALEPHHMGAQRAMQSFIK
jgi:Flp pilus assembly protein TadD/4-amino-4-deoxy-L-arabinose transferase-like glycosyltransferase